MDEKIIAALDRFEKRIIRPMSETYLGTLVLMLMAFVFMYIGVSAVVLILGALL